MRRLRFKPEPQRSAMEGFLTFESSPWKNPTPIIVVVPCHWASVATAVCRCYARQRLVLVREIQTKAFGLGLKPHRTVEVVCSIGRVTFVGQQLDLPSTSFRRVIQDPTND